MARAKPDPKLMRRILRDALQRSEAREAAIRRVIRSIPRGQVATYGQVAAAAGFPLYHRLVVHVLRHAGDELPWQRVLGAGGRIKLRGASAFEQRMRLELEGVAFRGKRVDLDKHQHFFRLWERQLKRHDGTDRETERAVRSTLPDRAARRPSE